MEKTKIKDKKVKIPKDKSIKIKQLNKKEKIKENKNFMIEIYTMKELNIYLKG